MPKKLFEKFLSFARIKGADFYFGCYDDLVDIWWAREFDEREVVAFCEANPEYEPVKVKVTYEEIN